MAVGLFRRVDKTHFIGDDEPADDRVQVGSLWSDHNAPGDLYICTAISPITFTLLVGSTGAPDGASYVVIGLNGTLTDERVLTAGTGIGIVDNGAGSTVVISATGSAATSFWPSLMLGGM